MTFFEILESIFVDIENAVRGIGSAAGLVTSYDNLPDAPSGPGDDSHVESRLEAMDPSVQAAFADLELQFAAALAPIGFTARRAETRRTNERQAWLYGIGRTWKAPGRKGIVTEFSTSSGPHGRGVAADYDYVGTGDAQALNATLARIAATRIDLTWGGTWAALNDTRHWGLA